MAYSREERERIIQYHLTRGNSLSRTSKEFGIGGSMTLAKWLKNFEICKFFCGLYVISAEIGISHGISRKRQVRMKASKRK